ncbi:MAG: ABC transporter ATP-binding protein/permease [Clostridiales bacterium]|jgi:ATP-binding cassette subfamily B protein|nr:ABC transporter ATP-binding protein/permease [Clostridiales bacterium]
MRGRRGGGPPHRAGMPVEKAKDFRGAMRQLIKYFGAEKGVIMLASLVAIGAMVMQVLSPKVLGGATDEIFDGIMNGAINFERIGTILRQMIVLVSLNILFNYVQGYIMAGVSMRITYKLRAQLSEKIHKLPLKFFDKNAHGDVLSRITNDADTLSNTLNSGLSQALMSGTQVLGIVIMMLTISPLLTLVAMMILPISAVCMTVIVKKSQKYFKAQQKNLGALNGHIEEMFTNHAIVKSFNGERASIEAFDEHNKKLYRAGWKANFLSGIIMPLVGFISNVGYVAIVVIGGAMALGGSMTIGGIQAFIQYTRQFGHPVAQLGGTVSLFQQTAAAAERVFAFLAEVEEAEIIAEDEGIPSQSRNDDYGVIASRNTPAFAGHVAFENVCFGYNADVTVIKNFTATVQPGQKIAIVGHTGAGKTTIVKLLMRFYDVNSGKISVDGKNINEYTRDNLRSHFGMVLQDTWLFSGTIAENIRYGSPCASDIEMKKAAQAAQAHHFIRTFPDSYNMQINEEADNISAGQKQLLTIARTLLADPDILILDEATSNVDTRTEIQIARAMDNLMRDRTCFIIAHRLSTIRSADLILVMHEGDIAEQGTHDSLLAAGGVYTKLYNSQFDVVE